MMHQPILSELFYGMLEFAKKKHVMIYTSDQDIFATLVDYDDERVYLHLDEGVGFWLIDDIVGMTVLVESKTEIKAQEGQ
jgi:hypothetical protein